MYRESALDAWLIDMNDISKTEKIFGLHIPQGEDEDRV
jgi:hypothetical protein